MKKRRSRNRRNTRRVSERIIKERRKQHIGKKRHLSKQTKVKSFLKKLKEVIVGKGNRKLSWSKETGIWHKKHSDNAGNTLEKPKTKKTWFFKKEF